MYPKVRVGRDDGPATEVDSFSAEVSPEAALLALQALHQTSRRLLRLGRTTRVVSHVDTVDYE